MIKNAVYVNENNNMIIVHDMNWIGYKWFKIHLFSKYLINPRKLLSCFYVLSIIFLGTWNKKMNKTNIPDLDNKRNSGNKKSK